MQEEKLILLWEHFNAVHNSVLQTAEERYEYNFTRKKRNEICNCFRIYPEKEGGHKIELSYFIGVDWIIKDRQAIYVAPKLNEESVFETNYLRMLFDALKHPEVADHTQDLFEIRWDQPAILITRQQDMLTPLLVAQFLGIVKQIVRKGLKKSYYKVTNNLYARVKGKVLVGETIKKNAVKNKPLNTWCSYDEFGLNGLENRLLKKTLLFIQRYMSGLGYIKAERYIEQMLGYIMPAFEMVTDEVQLHDILHTPANAFYKEYQEGIRLARLILQRFGYNITNTQTDSMLTPPFWIDMSKLFELYVLGLLKDRFGEAVSYQYSSFWNELDFLLNEKTEAGYKMVIDAKYKPIYRNKDKKDWDIENIRQISGYARLETVYKALYGNTGGVEPKVIDCLIIYPEALSDSIEFTSILPTDLKANKINPFINFYKLPIQLPTLNSKL